MSPRFDWPRGLRVLFWLSVASAILGTGRITYLAFTEPGAFIKPTLTGVYCTAAFILTWIMVGAGWRGARMAFVASSLIAISIHLFLVAFRSIQMGISILELALGGGLSLPEIEPVMVWHLLWDAVEVGMNLLIGFYL